MADRPQIEFGRRRPNRSPDLPPAPAPKRSKHVALLVMGTFAVGGGAHALMERDNCQPVPPPAPGIAAPAPPQGACTSRGSSYGGIHTSRSFFFSGGDSSSASTGGLQSSSSSVSRGGFGGLAHAFGFGGT
jgi:hypothetical protein